MTTRQTILEISICLILCIVLTTIDVFVQPFGSPITDIAWLFAVASLIILPLLFVRKIHPRPDEEAGTYIQWSTKGFLFGLVSVIILIIPVVFCHHFLRTSIQDHQLTSDIWGTISALDPPVWHECIIQILCIALPEEFFYRGYVQTNLQKVFQSIGKLSKYAIPLAILSASLLFAASHIPAGGIGRMITFFPGLLFGFIRYKTNGLVGAIFCHAMCNMMMYILVPLYF